jgi:hypothetical protein
MRENLKHALDLIEDCGKAYRMASYNIKRAFNQAIFEKIMVYNITGIQRAVQLVN